MVKTAPAMMVKSANISGKMMRRESGPESFSSKRDIGISPPAHCTVFAEEAESKNTNFIK